MKKQEFRVIGRIGFSDNAPFFEQVRDAYSEDCVWRAELFKSYRAAKQRFQDVKAVQIGPRPKRGGKKR